MNSTNLGKKWMKWPWKSIRVEREPRSDEVNPANAMKERQNNNRINFEGE